MALALAAGFAVWEFLGMIVTFAVGYGPKAVLWTVLALFWTIFGAAAWALLRHARPHRGLLAALVPLPTAAVMLYDDFALRQIYYVPWYLVFQLACYAAGAAAWARLEVRAAGRPTGAP